MYYVILHLLYKITHLIYKLRVSYYIVINSVCICFQQMDSDNFFKGFVLMAGM